MFLSIILFSLPLMTISMSDLSIQKITVSKRDQQDGLAFWSKQNSLKNNFDLLNNIEKTKPEKEEDGTTNRPPPRIIIIGGPASGKGTQCEYITSKYNIIHLSTGEILRDAVRKNDNSRICRSAKHYMDRGELLPDEVMIEIVSNRLKEDDCQKHGWLLDGFPRTKAQAEHLFSSSKTAGAVKATVADVIIIMNVPDKELIDRVVGRRIDPITGKIYHIKYKPPPTEEIIRNRLIQRSDDTLEKMNLRLENFHRHLSCIRTCMAETSSATSMVEINGSGSPEIIAAKIAAAIDSKVGHCCKVVL